MCNSIEYILTAMHYRISRLSDSFKSKISIPLELRANRDALAADSKILIDIERKNET